MSETTPLARKLGPFDATMVVVSGIIGSGIFINPFLVAQQVETPLLILLVWVAGGVIALCGAFVFAELATVLPRAGGQYAYLREAFHPLLGFLHGWSLMFIIQSGATAAVAVACAEYAVRLGALPPGWVVPLALAILAGVTLFHALGVKPGAVLINLVTLAKTVALAALIVGAFAVAGPPAAAAAAPASPLGGGALVSAFLGALIPTMFAYGGWQSSCYLAEEIRDPERHLPRAILVGVAIVIAVYLGANVAYLHVLGATALAATRTPAADLAAAVLGERGADAMSVLVVVSTFGFLNLALMAAPRVYYAMARDGLFFRRVAQVSARTRAPVAAIVTQGVLASAFALTSSYDELLGYAVFADWIFFALAGVALLVFRRTRPRAPRPYPVPLYPWTALLFVAAAAGIVLNAVVVDTRNAAIGLAIICAGVPAFFLWTRR